MAALLKHMEFDDLQHLHELLPAHCIDECTRSGYNEYACELWINKLQLSIDRDEMIGWLNGMGAWEDEELDAMTDKQLTITCLWIASGYGE